MAAASYRDGINRRLANLRRRHPAHYAQLVIGPAFHKPPSYAMEDPKHVWWTSDEARRLYESINEKFIGIIGLTLFLLGSSLQCSESNSHGQDQSFRQHESRRLACRLAQSRELAFGDCLQD